MAESIKISIIMPSLNVGKYMRDCLESVVNQSLKDIEIICVDAGSTDETLEIIQEYASKDNRIKIINSSVKSYGYQMNLGLDAALGEYIGIVETDDYVDSDMFEKMYHQVKNYEVDFVKGGYVGFIGTDGTIERKNFDAISKDIQNKKLDLNINRHFGILSPVHIWSGLYRRQFLVDNNIRFNETPGASFQDTSFSILVGMLAESCAFTDDAFYHYRMDNANSSVKSASKITCVVEEYAYLVSKLIELGKYNDEVREIVERYKLNTYIWNYKRLNVEGRHTFIDAINEEMSYYVDNKLNWTLTDEERQKVELLTNPSLIQKDIEKEESYYNQIRTFVADCKKGMKFNVVGAGRLFDKIINIQKAIKCDFIETLSDNSINLQNTIINGYSVNSVEWAKENSKCDNWIILNKKYSNEILDQLVNLGVNTDNIRVFTQLIDIDLLKDFCM